MDSKQIIKILIVGLTTVLAMTVFNENDFKKELTIVRQFEI
ncbi:hypothetical protein [Flavobacterium crocinum]|nr:hypothetical protein [Flavobacterium crocinum]